MATAPAPYLRAWRHSHDRLRTLVDPSDSGQLNRQSYASEWTIAQVLSHIGSGAEIFSLFLDAGRKGEDPPGRETMEPIWNVWNARSPEEQAAHALASDQAALERFASVDATEQERFHINLFGGDVDLAVLARMRLSEHAIHTWDIATALDPAATVAPDAVDLLIDTLGQLASRTGKPRGTAMRVHVSTTDPERQFVLDIGESVSLLPWDGEERLPELHLPAEAFLRLIYGRLDPDHTPPADVGAVDLDQLRATFPGF
jgi:uncharacterized protein (TIGR03083 family)